MIKGSVRDDVESLPSRRVEKASASAGNRIYDDMLDDKIEIFACKTIRRVTPMAKGQIKQPTNREPPHMYVCVAREEALNDRGRMRMGGGGGCGGNALCIMVVKKKGGRKKKSFFFSRLFFFSLFYSY